MSDHHSSSQMPIKQWSYPGSTSASQQNRTCLIILNTPICASQPQRFLDLWLSADLTICADGGANRLYEFDPTLKLRPNYIKGDLDSIRPSVRALYGHPTCILHDSNQDSTDLGKCIELVEELEMSSEKPFQILIHGGLGGRLDHTFHTLHTLLIMELGRQGKPAQGYRSQAPRRGAGDCWVVDTHAGSFACALESGHVHRFPIPKEWKRESALTCGLLPIGVDAALVTTRGLRWNLEKTPTSMTGLLSTSNQVAKDTTTVEIETDRAVLWTMELPSLRE